MPPSARDPRAHEGTADAWRRLFWRLRHWSRLEREEVDLAVDHFARAARATGVTLEHVVAEVRALVAQTTAAADPYRRSLLEERLVGRAIAQYIAEPRRDS